MLQRHF